MMPMPKGVTAWETEPQRKMRGVILPVFWSGVMVGFAGATIPAHRWWLYAWFLATAALFAHIAWDSWRKIP
jgi:hypothetical protein